MKVPMKTYEKYNHKLRVTDDKITHPRLQSASWRDLQTLHNIVIFSQISMFCLVEPDLQTIQLLPIFESAPDI